MCERVLVYVTGMPLMNHPDNETGKRDEEKYIIVFLMTMVNVKTVKK